MEQKAGSLTLSVLEAVGGKPGLKLTFTGRLDSTTTAEAWQKAVGQVESQKPRFLELDAAGLDYCDLSGISLFLELRRRLSEAGGEFRISGLKEETSRLLDYFDPAAFSELVPQKYTPPRQTEELGRVVHETWRDALSLIAFVGELSSAMLAGLRRPSSVRWTDAWHVAETTGVNALPIVAMISFLVGLIMAFQAAVPMRIFGAEIFVANLIALSVIRELGPLMTAIILAGRSGSSFAAELGTMKVNEEIDALTTMGLDPVRFLVVPRVFASIIMTPLLTVFANLVGLLGGAVVLLSLGYPLVVYVNQVLASVNYVDFLGGLVKSVVFAVMISGVGCLRGLQTGTGASAVGDSTTRAVVSGIVLIVVVDGIFSVVYFYLGI